MINPETEAGRHTTRAQTKGGRVLDLGLDLNVWPWVWLFIAVAFTLLEITLLGGSFVLLPFAVSAFAASLLGFYDTSIEVQWAVFLFGGGALWIGFYRWAKRFLRDNILPPGVGADRLVGMNGVVTVMVSPDDAGRRGRISVAGETWGANAGTDVTLQVGTRVVITALEGTRAVVKAVKSDEPDQREDHP